MRWGSLGALVAALAWSSCGGDGGATSDAGGGGGRDAAGGPCPVACNDAEACRYAACVPTPVPCSGTDQCPGDAYCDRSAGECLPWGVGPGGFSDAACTREVVPGVFFPDVQCEWLGPPPGDPYPDHTNVLAAPVVADFGASGDPELPRPSIVFTSYNFTDGGNDACRGDTPEHFGVIRVIDGRTCQQLANIAAPVPIASASLLLADVNDDGTPEIIAVTVGGGLAAWEYRGGGSFVELWQSDTAFAADACVWTGPSAHDLDDDGLPEILLYGAVYGPDGHYITDVGRLSATLLYGYIPVVADVDADGQPELVAGSAVYGWDRPTRAWVREATLGRDAQVAVADLGTFGADPAGDDRATLDGLAEVVAIVGGTATVYALGGRVVFGPTSLSGTGSGGAPTIADFDGDGRAEFASANGTAYSVFDLDCVGIPDESTCPTLAGDGVLWSRPSQDGSSNRTGSSVFDFEGDGTAEAVYADECFTRVYDGSSGEVVYSRYRTSCTWYENPVIADTDADFGAEILVGSNTNCRITCPPVDPIFDGINCFDESDCPGATTCVRDGAGDPIGKCRCGQDADCGGDGFVCLDPIAGPSAAGKVCRASHPGPSTAMGLRVIGDRLGRWVGTRRIWNQHAYAVTNILDDGRVPRTSLWRRNWDDPTLNNFRQNAPGEGAGAGLMPDLTVRGGSYQCAGSGAAELEVEVCNRGTEAVADGVAVTVYLAGDAVLCTTATRFALRPGSCETVSCSARGLPTSSAIAIKAVVDDDGAASGTFVECRELNNGALIKDVVCP
jgi:hypothetical protein